MFVPMSFCLHLGYGPNSPFYHIWGDDVGRGVWGLLVGLSASLGLFLCGFVPLYMFISYLIMSFTLENQLKSLDQDIGDPIFGLSFAFIILLVK
jgi:hypothetical protein